MQRNKRTEKLNINKIFQCYIHLLKEFKICFKINSISNKAQMSTSTWCQPKK